MDNVSENNTENIKDSDAGHSVTCSDKTVDKLTEDLKSLWVEKYAPKTYTELLSEEVSYHFYY